jgi:glucose/arabinose dehydrogenase
MKRLALMVLVGMLVGCTGIGSKDGGVPEEQNEEVVQVVPEEQEETVVQVAPEEQDEVIVQGTLDVLAERLEVPWSIQKFGDVFYISERPGAIVKVEEGRVERQKVVLKRPLSGEAEAGLLGFVLGPDFEVNRKAFAYYTYDEAGSPFNRVVVLTLEGDVWRETKVLLDGIPSGPVHHGGRVEIGPDGLLYFSAGDAAEPETAQRLDNLNGKILRMNLDGSVPSDNPIRGSYIYSYGHRNPQGLAWDEEGLLYESEHGQSAHDELNRIVAGKNYGWPVIQGDEKREGMESPIFHTGDVTWAPSGIAYWNGKLYVATLRGEALMEVDLATMRSREVVTGVGRIRDVLVDGEYLYFISNNTDGRGNPSAGDDKLYSVRLGKLE